MATRKAPSDDMKAPNYDLEYLFDNFFRNTAVAMFRLHKFFGFEDAVEQVFGTYAHFGTNPSDVPDAAERLRQSSAWRYLEQLHDYAVNGIDRISVRGSITDGTSSLLIDAEQVIALLTCKEQEPCREWSDLIEMGEARFSLEEGEWLAVPSLALLAKVDVRTVRNAISAGQLVSKKHGQEVLVDNDSARRWLMGRKGFKPTIVLGRSGPSDLSQLHTAHDFATFVRHLRSQPVERSLAACPGLTEQHLAEAEAGVFQAPLSVTRPMADYFGLPRAEFLQCVMRVFFPDELEDLKSLAGSGSDGSLEVA